MTTILSQICSLIQKIELCRRNLVVPYSFRTGLKLANTNLLHSSSPVEFLKLFLTDDFVSKMAEQTNFYAVQRGAPRSFKPVSDGVTNLYLYTNIHTDSWRRLETIFGCSLCKTHPGSELMFCSVPSQTRYPDMQLSPRRPYPQC